MTEVQECVTKSLRWSEYHGGRLKPDLDLADELAAGFSWVLSCAKLKETLQNVILCFFSIVYMRVLLQLWEWLEPAP